jgi:hypothetical protein
MQVDVRTPYKSMGYKWGVAKALQIQKNRSQNLTFLSQSERKLPFETYPQNLLPDKRINHQIAEP